MTQSHLLPEPRYSVVMVCVPHNTAQRSIIARDSYAATLILGLPVNFQIILQISPGEESDTEPLLYPKTPWSLSSYLITESGHHIGEKLCNKYRHSNCWQLREEFQLLIHCRYSTYECQTDLNNL